MDKPGFDLVAYLKLFRFPLVFTAISDSAAGYLVARKGWSVDWATLLWLALSSSGLYFFGMALNDIADRKRDLELAPGRPIPSGRVTLKGAVAACLLMLVLSGLAQFMSGGRMPEQRFLVWGGAVACIFAYDCFLKLPPVMGLVRALNFELGLLAGLEPGYGGLPPGICVMLALPSFLYVTSLTIVSTLEDRLSARSRLFTGLLGMIGAAFAPLLFAGTRSGPGEAWLPLMLGAWLCYRAIGARDRKGVMRLVRDGIGGIIALNAITLVCAVGWIPALGLLLLLIPALIAVEIFKRLA